MSAKLSLVIAIVVSSALGTVPKPFGIDKRIPLTTSKVVGSPEPPPPFRVRPAFPNLKIKFPVTIRHVPGTSDLLIIHQDRSYGATSLSRIKDDPGTSEHEVLQMSEDTCYDICFHPDFKKNGYLYIGSNGPQKGTAEDKHTRIVRYTLKNGKLEDKTEIIRWWSNGHNGGSACFGHDGMLYVTTGDGTSDSDTKIVGQDMTSLLAKVLRIDVDRVEAGKTYSIPKDNPFLTLSGARPEIWALGTRNPWRITVDEKTGHIWVAQNGQDLWEQAFLVKKGDNYGWSVTEGSHPFYPTRKSAPAPIVKPTVEHHHSEARSLTGGLVYYGKNFPELQGAYIYADYSTGKVWAVKHDGQKILWHKEIADTRLQITHLAPDSKGEILISDHRGDAKPNLYTLERTPAEVTPSTFPKKLSESGLFRTVKGHVMEPAMIPYSVIAPLWGDNAHKERWIGLPGKDTTIDFAHNRGWNFPDGTVIVKSFALDMEEGNAASRRWIETRFLTNQKGEWVGYSYAWNDEQTEAYLVESKGKDRDLTIRTPKGERKQSWHFPSRAECMVCHSRAANWVLGLQTLQMNKEHDYAGVKDNQLRTLDHIGVMKGDWHGEIRKLVEDQDKANKKNIAKEWLAARPKGEKPVESFIAFTAEKNRRLVDPYDPKEDINLRARSYLHSNCAQCHVEAGGGNAQMNLEFLTNAEKTKLFDVPPVHDSYGLKDARLVAPGHPERSVLLHRIGHRGRGQMPPLATSLVDQPAVEMLGDWIKVLKPHEKH